MVKAPTVRDSLFKSLMALVLGGCLALGARSVAAADTAPALNRLADLLGEHHYHQVLRQTNALLNLNHAGRARQGIDRYQLMQFKGEALLRLKLFDAAADAYTSVARFASTVRQARIARATAALISQSIAGYYAPRRRSDHGLGPVRINILPLSLRKQAMRAFYRDQWALLKPRIAAALQRSGLRPLLRLFTALRLAVDAETAAGRKSTKTGDNPDVSLHVSDPAAAAVDSCTQRIDRLTSRGLKTMKTRINAIITSSNTLIFFRHRTGRRGVTQPEVNDLQNMIQTCRDILLMIKRFQRVFPDFPTDCAQLRHLKSKALQVETLAHNTLP